MTAAGYLALPARVDVPADEGAGTIIRTSTLLLLWGGSFAVGALAGAIPGLATVHGFALLGVGIVVGLRAQKPSTVATWAFAVAASGVFWRMHEAKLPYEAAKYGASLIALLYILRRRQVFDAVLPVTYMALLSPAVLLTFAALPFGDARRTLVFNLAGPALLSLFLLLLGGTRPGRRTRVHWIVALATGCFLVLGALVRIRVAGGAATYMGVNSNFAASGGFGPNQVSSVLGLGSVLVFALVLNSRATRLIAIGGMLAAQGFLAFALITLSRGGVYSAILSLVVMLGYLVFSSKPIPRGVVTSLLILVLVSLATLPLLETETSGMLSRRYGEFHVTGRDRRAAEDIEAMAEYPILGRGVGMAHYDSGYLAHSEATRMLGDHGVLGALALIVLMMIGFRGVTRSEAGVPRATSVLLFTWAITFTLHAAVRIALPAALFAFGVMALRDGEEDLPPLLDASHG